jgi:hypothetical protein
MGLDMENDCAEIKVRAERRLGEVLTAMPKNRGAATRLDDQTSLALPKLEDIGLNKFESHQFQQVAAVPEPQFEQHIAETKAAGERLTTAVMFCIAARGSPGVPWLHASQH